MFIGRWVQWWKGKVHVYGRDSSLKCFKDEEMDTWQFGTMKATKHYANVRHPSFCFTITYCCPDNLHYNQIRLKLLHLQKPQEVRSD